MGEKNFIFCCEGVEEGRFPDEKIGAWVESGLIPFIFVKLAFFDLNARQNTWVLYYIILIY